MKLACIRISNFRSFGEDPVDIDLADTTFLLGPNGAGKTAVLHALSRMFSLDPAQRRIQLSDFHVPHEIAGEEVPKLWIEAIFEFPVLEDEDSDVEDAGIPANFAHMQLVSEDGPVQVRFRLAATLDEDGDIEETFTYVTEVDEDGDPVQESQVLKQDRNSIQVHYLPTRRNPADHVSYSANALIGRLLRSADWSGEREQIKELAEQMGTSLTDNAAVSEIGEILAKHWGKLHKGSYFVDPAMSFAGSEVESLLRHLSISFSPGHGQAIVDFSSLSDGQQSLLYGKRH